MLKIYGEKHVNTVNTYSPYYLCALFVCIMQIWYHPSVPIFARLLPRFQLSGQLRAHLINSATWRQLGAGRYPNSDPVGWMVVVPPAKRLVSRVCHVNLSDWLMKCIWNVYEMYMKCIWNVWYLHCAYYILLHLLEFLACLGYLGIHFVSQEAQVAPIMVENRTHPTV